MVILATRSDGKEFFSGISMMQLTSEQVTRLNLALGKFEPMLSEVVEDGASLPNG